MTSRNKAIDSPKTPADDHLSAAKGALSEAPSLVGEAVDGTPVIRCVASGNALEAGETSLTANAAGGTLELRPAGGALLGAVPEKGANFIATHPRAEGGVQKLVAIVADAHGQVGIEQALYESREELRRLSGLLVSIQEDERRRIALDLHDGLGQSLSLIKLAIEKSAGLLAQGATSEAGESLQQLIPRVEEALVEVRRVSTDLRPLILDDLGILPTLSWFFREFQTVCDGMVVETIFNVAECDVPIPLHITLYRILQEAIHNIVKHAGADRVRVRLDRNDGALHLVIEDNGCGFDPDSVKWVERQTRGLGLLSMKERASFSGGNFHLCSAPGQGTQIRVSWPAGVCHANVDCCRTSECGDKEVPCRANKATQYDYLKNTVHRV